jgi:Bacterial protein of unknown function (Gcw_chp)
MKKLVISTTAAFILSTGLAPAADMAVKVPAAAPVVAPNPFDIAFGAQVMTDYNFRGISQSNNRPSVNAYFEPRYNFNPNWQIYAGVGGYSIEFPNNAAAEIDIYGGIRPTFDKLALDFGVWYYYYPGGRTFTGFTGLAPNLFDPNPFCTNLFTALNGFCNAIKSDLSFVEFYAKATYTFNDNFAVAAQFYYDPTWLNSGAPGYYLNGNVKYTGTALPNGIGWYVSGDIAHYWLGTTDAFYAFTPLPDYTTWDVGFGLTYKVFTVDFRYYDTDLSKANCNVLTGDHTATVKAGFITPLNPSGLGSKWCDATFIVALKVDATLNANIK